VRPNAPNSWGDGREDCQIDLTARDGEKIGAMPVHDRPGVCRATVSDVAAVRTPSEVVLAFLRGAHRGDPAAFDLLAEDLVNHAAGPQGRAGMRQTAQTLEADLGPGRLEVHHVVAEGELVVVHLTLHGHHKASTMPLLVGVPATGQTVAWEFVHLFRVSDGLVQEHWATRDDLGLLRGLGAWGPGGAAGPHE